MASSSDSSHSSKNFDVRRNSRGYTIQAPSRVEDLHHDFPSHAIAKRLRNEVDVEEVMYIAKELWHGQSARDQSKKDVGRGMWRSVNELVLVRWDQAKPASVSNLVLLKFQEADEHESRTLEDIKDNEAEFFSRVTSVLKRAELDFSL